MKDRHVREKSVDSASRDAHNGLWSGSTSGGTEVIDLEPLKDLTELQYLGLSDTQVSALEPLKALTNLQRLYLGGTQVSDEQVASLKHALPHLRIVQ